MRNSAIARLVVDGRADGGLLIPLDVGLHHLSERASRRDGAVAEVSATWGGPQTVGGPVLAVPYRLHLTDAVRPQRSASNASTSCRAICRSRARSDTETRRRGIFDVVVYRTNLKLRGTFVRPELEGPPRPGTIDWDRTSLCVGVADPRGLARRAALRLARSEAVPSRAAPETSACSVLACAPRAGARAPRPPGRRSRSNSPRFERHARPAIPARRWGDDRVR